LLGTIADGSQNDEKGGVPDNTNSLISENMVEEKDDVKKEEPEKIDDSIIEEGLEKPVLDIDDQKA